MNWQCLLSQYWQDGVICSYRFCLQKPWSLCWSFWCRCVHRALGELLALYAHRGLLCRTSLMDFVWYKTSESDSVSLLVAGLLKNTSALHLLPDSTATWPLGGSHFRILHNLSNHTYTDGSVLPGFLNILSWVPSLKKNIFFNTLHHASGVKQGLLKCSHSFCCLDRLPKSSHQVSWWWDPTCLY